MITVFLMGTETHKCTMVDKTCTEIFKDYVFVFTLAIYLQVSVTLHSPSLLYGGQDAAWFAKLVSENLTKHNINLN